ncbi:Spy/CpxP family protein refolding chaperone [Azospirillum agricola]|uniref:Spy/CpxP family protein refolding chaperone n=1 Tax=Azospirillum agricola TaxID=1720247 RepID=UPI000A0F0E81|nr:Spy/CpxP family protein refolding chaperone [Azospirillum agricola]SMH61563.1 LTXXQ motif family protein [Azospirillum lipoferum]
MKMTMDQMGSMTIQPDDQAGMMSIMHRMMVGQPAALGLPPEHIEGRIALVKTELIITDAQMLHWNALEDVLRTNVKAHQGMPGGMMAHGRILSSWPERMTFQQKVLWSRLGSLEALETAAKPLYAALVGEPRTRADQRLVSPMGTM